MARSKGRWRGLAGALALGVGAAAPARAAAPLPFLQIFDAEPEGRDGGAFALSGEGVYALISGLPTMPDDIEESRRWSQAEGFLPLGACLPAVPGYTDLSPEGIARGLSGPGDVVAGRARYRSDQEEFVEAVVWEIEQTCSAQLLGDLAGGARDSGANAVSADGAVLAGWATDAEGRKAVRWDHGALSVLGDGDLPGGPPGAAVEAEVTGLSSDASVAVGFGATDFGREPFRWEAGTGLHGLGHLGGQVTEATAVSGDGSIVVGFDIDTLLIHSRAFRWEARTGMRELPGLLGTQVHDVAYAISADGSRIGGTSESSAVVWDRGRSARRVEELLAALGVEIPEGWVLRTVNALSAEGSTLTGSASPTSPASGPRRAWIAYAPEPASGAAALVALLGLTRARRPALPGTRAIP